MRVHGDKIIKRRTDVAELDDYRDAKDRLKQDFHNLCGYCGKDYSIMREKFHIDHFVPKSIDSDRINDYNNLVFACAKCNLIKSKKWPTRDKNLAHDGEIGFVDPASSEYDDHMERDEQGYIRGRTKLGKQICENLNFNIRRTDLYWKIQALYGIQEKLEELYYHGSLSEDVKNFYIQTNILLKKYIQNAFDVGE